MRDVYTFEDLVFVWSAMRRSRTWHHDLAQHGRQRYLAYARAFGADLEKAPDPPPPTPEWMSQWRRENPQIRWGPGDRDWPRWVLRVATSYADYASELTGPFSGQLEATAPMLAARRHVGEPPEDAVSAARSACLAATIELMRCLYPAAASRSVTREQIRAAGFDHDAPAPDPWDYF